MSDRCILSFDFGLDPHLPDEALAAFVALARGQKPTEKQLAVFHHELQGHLKYGLDGFLITETDMTGSPVFVFETGVINNPDNQYHPIMPTHQIRMVCQMHDDAYGNGGFGFPLLMFDLAGDHGLFCTIYTQSQRDALTLYYKEFDDLVVVQVNAPDTHQPLPPYASVEPERYLQGWQPAQPNDFGISSVTRYNGDERRSLIDRLQELYE